MPDWFGTLSDAEDEAIGFYDGIEEAMPDAFRSLLTAARALLAGQPIQWCETCDDKARPPCWNSVGTPIEGHGLIHSIVPARLVF